MSKSLVEMTAEIVQSQIGTKEMSSDEIKGALNETFQTLKCLQDAEAAGQPLEQSGTEQTMAPERSIQKNKVICLECGQSFKMLSPKHLSSHGLTPREYRKKLRFFHAAAALRQGAFRKTFQVGQETRPAGKPEKGHRRPHQEKK